MSEDPIRELRDLLRELGFPVDYMTDEEVHELVVKLIRRFGRELDIDDLLHGDDADGDIDT